MHEEVKTENEGPDIEQNLSNRYLPNVQHLVGAASGRGRGKGSGQPLSEKVVINSKPHAILYFPESTGFPFKAWIGELNRTRRVQSIHVSESEEETLAGRRSDPFLFTIHSWETIWIVPLATGCQ